MRREAPAGLAELKETVRSGERFKRVCFSCLDKTWRQEASAVSIVSKGKLLAYLNPVVPKEPETFSRRTGISITNSVPCSGVEMHLR